jgi:hypothetical protein
MNKVSKKKTKDHKIKKKRKKTKIPTFCNFLYSYHRSPSLTAPLAFLKTRNYCSKEKTVPKEIRKRKQKKKN